MRFGKSKMEYPKENEMCAFCENCNTIGESGACICRLKGVVRSDGFCKKFKFDLLKLNPRAVKLPLSCADDADDLEKKVDLI